MKVKTEYLDSEGIRIYTELYLPEGNPPFSAVCICHGLPARLPDPTERGYPLLAEAICRQGTAALIFNFRGCGLSGGNFEMPGWLTDLKTVLDYLFNKPEIDPKQVHLLGFSAGAAASICVGARDKRVRSVISCASPADFHVMKERDIEAILGHFREIQIIRDCDIPESPREWLSEMRAIRPVEVVVGISPRPLLIIHGDADDTVPVETAYKLYEQAREPKKLIILPGASHRLRLDERAVRAINDWLKDPPAPQIDPKLT